MSEPLGKREIVAWTICGVLAVAAGVLYSRGAPGDGRTGIVSPAPIATSPAPPPPNTVFVKGDTSVKYQEARIAAAAEVKRLRDSIANARLQRVRDSMAAAQAEAERQAQQPAPRGEMSEPLRRPAPPHPDSARIRIGSRTPNVTLLINDQPAGPLSSVRWFMVPAGPLALTLRAPNCQSWDTTVTLRGGSDITLGYRMARC